MRRPRNGICHRLQLCFLILFKLVLAQDPTSTTDQATPTTMQTTTLPVTTHHKSAFPYLSSSMMFAPSDSASAGNHQNGVNSTGLVNYYFVFLALIVAVAGVVVFLIMRRRRRAVLRRRYGQDVALSRDLGGPREGGGWSNWSPERTRGRYWQGRWRSAEASREEGLNEQGEAPPPYIPKRESQEAQRETVEPAIPLQTLSRDDTGLKPPDYSDYHSQDTDGASTSRQGNQQTNP